MTDSPIFYCMLAILRSLRKHIIEFYDLCSISLYALFTGKFSNLSNVGQVSKYRKVIVYHDAVPSIFLNNKSL